MLGRMGSRPTVPRRLLPGQALASGVSLDRGKLDDRQKKLKPVLDVGAAVTRLQVDIGYRLRHRLVRAGLK